MLLSWFYSYWFSKLWAVVIRSHGLFWLWLLCSSADKKECYSMNYVNRSKAITIYFCNRINVLFSQVIYFKWTANILPVCLLSIFIPLAFVIISDVHERLLVGIKFLILFSNSHMISSPWTTFSVYLACIQGYLVNMSVLLHFICNTAREN